MRTLICGSLAFDSIMVFQDHFKHHILPDKIHMLNVSFLVPELRREYGGCAGNIAYNLKLLGGEPVIMATVGDDFGPYADRLDGLGVTREAIRHLPGTYTAQAFITTDLADNQITAFHPGAMQQAHRIELPQRDDLKIAIIAPDGRDGMLRRAAQLHAAGIPFVFDPGQQLPMFDGAELKAFVERARWIAVNDYEGRMLCERTGLSLQAMSRLGLDGVVVTLGHEGCDLWVEGRCERVPGVAATEVVDPTGCGDAFRGALLFGLEQGWPLRRCVELGNRLGALKIAHRGGQNHPVDRSQLGL